ncbi:MAG: hypothetical protein KGS61_22060 [Verrucomicrobia bacterium]|nr:hypothetical protein [Verrucomicrobiota bacterium]
MKHVSQQIVIGGCALWLSVAGFCQEPPVDRVSVPLNDPSRPALVKASLMSGGITVKGYDGKEVVVEARLRQHRSDDEDNPDQKAGGLKRIDVATTGLTAEEEDNVVSVSTGPMRRGVDLVIRVPFKTSLKLGCMNDGEVLVEKVTGEIEASNLNGGVTLRDVSGVVVAHSLNGVVNVNLDRVTPDKPMSFSTLNGDIDVTLPAKIKANVKMETQNGSIYSDFEIQLNTNARQPTVEDGRKGGGRYRVVIDKARFGAINGGGPEFYFKTVNGNIHIRKGK